ncbi:hypothetical protein BU23DRAFT_565685 [Bimuria novae-zelandiae CBS 107.79]|uniref:Uncharacterized protein n=1 Tax=Bimuria novae-zelandiae CBS 107.79 TaxID=1447943 RepID=A0A6A5VIR8_9PLEO|nr:hypothetical protein BU23DRAFT_565685 [Bimuria novae-zelandiae CBS 107.79]
MSSNGISIPPFYIPALTALLERFAFNYERTRAVFRLLDIQFCHTQSVWYSEPSTYREELFWSDVFDTEIFEDLDEFHTTSTPDGELRAENKITDEIVREAWLEHREEFLESLRDQIPMEHLVALAGLAGGDDEEDEDTSAVKEYFVNYTEWPQCRTAEVELPDAPEPPVGYNRSLTQLLQNLATDTQQGTGSAVCSVMDVGHVLKEVFFLVHHARLAITTCMEDECFWDVEYSVDEFDPIGGLKCRIVNIIMGPYQNRLGDPNSLVPEHVRRVLASGLPVSTAFNALPGLDEHFRPGSVSQKDREWLGNLEVTAGQEILKGAPVHLNHMLFGEGIKMFLLKTAPHLGKLLEVFRPDN